jgi:hypothetical protein
MSARTPQPVRRRLAAIAAAAAAAALLAGTGPAAAQAAGARAPFGSIWGNAIEVPGSAALNTGGLFSIGQVSCASAGNCSAVATYTDSSGHRQVFVVNQVKGTWGNAIEVPGTAALNTGGGAYGNSVSCPSAGNCSAGGSYTKNTPGDPEEAFVVNEVNGTWHKAIEVPGTAALNPGGVGSIGPMSCASAGNCSAGGGYAASLAPPVFEVFVVSQVKGTWGKAEEVPGIAALNTDSNADIFSLSCASAGNCTAGGVYDDGSNHDQAFLVNQVKGSWGNAFEVPGTAALNTGGLAEVASVSCASPGNCSAGGTYKDSFGQQAFVVSEVNGIWGKAEEVPGTAALNTGSGAGINSVSCASAGNCSAAGVYKDSSGHHQAFVVSQVKGKWGKAEEVPGIAPINTGNSEVASVSCASAGNCSTGGIYKDTTGNHQAFVVNQVNGIWGNAEEVPGTAALNTGGYAVFGSVSCPLAGNCSADGLYKDSFGKAQAFVVSQT